VRSLSDRGKEGEREDISPRKRGGEREKNYPENVDHLKERSMPTERGERGVLLSFIYRRRGEKDQSYHDRQEEKRGKEFITLVLALYVSEEREKRWSKISI